MVIKIYFKHLNAGVKYDDEEYTTTITTTTTDVGDE